MVFQIPYERESRNGRKYTFDPNIKSVEGWALKAEKELEPRIYSMMRGTRKRFARFTNRLRGRGKRTAKRRKTKKALH